ncbi:hypothetical protein LJC19_06745 [Oxalobacter sp. OttesenSCG-928-P03]|nr:hypothetical protein [Oxalobacter sp. OttesenSCG-928-P03]
MKNHFMSRLILGFMFFAAAGTIHGVRAQDTGSAQAMRNAYAKLKPELENSPYKSPLRLNSSQGENKADGEIYGILNHPFSAVRKNLQDPAGWCEILFLHLNVKYCRAIENSTIRIYVGTKKPQSLDTATEIRYRFKKIADRADYLKIAMTAASGPYGTSNYNISMEAIPLNTRQSFIFVNYGYQYGTVAKLAMNTYLGTIGSDKEGLTIIGKKADGSPEYASGIQGVIERNTMRYYLAVSAWLDSLSAPKGEQLNRRLSSWFDATERYPQLHEISKSDYMNMKKDEYRRMQKEAQKTGMAR